MHPITIGKNYCFRLSDGRSLGHLRIERMDDSWAEGPFVPSDTFEEFRELFEKEANLRRQQVIPLWEDAADAIEALQIQVIEEECGVAQPGFRVFIEGNEAILGAPLAVP